jgi:hypothetical protein
MNEVDDWVEDLAGRGKGEATDAQAVRTSLRQHDAAQADGIPAERDLRFVALLSRLEREGLLTERRSARATMSGWPLRVAAMLLLAVGIGVVLDSMFEPALQPQLSGNFDDAPRFRGPAPAAIAEGRDTQWLERSLDRLQALSWPYRLSRQQQDWLLEFYVPSPLSAEGAAWLQAEGITPQDNGWVILRVAE